MAVMLAVAVHAGLVLASDAQDASSEATIRIDRIVAVVDQDTVTETELMAEARLALVLRGAMKAAQAPLSASFLETFLDYLVNQLLISTEARRLGAVEVSDDELVDARQALIDNFPSTAAFRRFLSDFGVSEERLNASLLRDLRNGRYVTNRMRVRLIGSELAPSSPEYRRALKLWLDELRDASKIRLLGEDNRLTVIESGDLP